MKTRILFSSLFLMAITLHGQTSAEHFISGTVVDFDGEPLLGATISLSGKPKGTLTDHKGAFRIPASNEDMLRIAYAGFQTIELYPEEIEYELKGRIELKEGNWLREVVITGFHEEVVDCEFSVIHCFTACGPIYELATKDTLIVPDQSKIWQYYPNPTIDGVTVFTEDAMGMISVFSSDGKQVLRQKVTETQTRIDLTSLSAGMYHLYHEQEGLGQSIGKVALVRG